MAADTAALALIPARGGSKGIPGKNLREVGGIPLVVRCIYAAKASDRVRRIVVSTDDDAIANVSWDAGADVIKRPKTIAGDMARSEAALLHALDELRTKSELEEHLVFLQCTSPFTTGKQIDKVLAALDENGVGSSLAVTDWKGFLWRSDGQGINHDPHQPRERRQDIEPAYLETGSIYAMETSLFRSTGHRFCERCQPVIVDNIGPEIDTPSDLALCEILQASFSS